MSESAPGSDGPEVEVVEISLPEVDLIDLGTIGFGLVARRTFELDEVIERAPLLRFSGPAGRLPESIQQRTFQLDFVPRDNDVADSPSSAPTLEASGRAAAVRRQVRRVLSPVYQRLLARHIRAGVPIGLPMGYGTIYNHSDEPNVYCRRSDDDELMIYRAARTIEAGEQLTISYNAPAGLGNGDPEHDWFQKMGIEKLDL